MKFTSELELSKSSHILMFPISVLNAPLLGLSDKVGAKVGKLT